MSVDRETVMRVATLSRISIDETRAEELRDDLNSVLSFVEQLNAVNVEGVEPLTSVIDMPIKRREDQATDGDKVDEIIANAPESEDGFFLVPKVVE